MITIPAGVRVFMATKPVDFRKGADGLVALVRESLSQDPFAESVFIFRAKRAQSPTFCIRFSFCDNSLPLASIVWANGASFAISPRQGIDVHLHGRAA